MTVHMYGRDWMLSSYLCVFFECQNDKYSFGKLCLHFVHLFLWLSLLFVEAEAGAEAEAVAVAVGVGVGVKFLHIERKITSVVHSHPPSHYIRTHTHTHTFWRKCLSHSFTSTLFRRVTRVV